MPAPVKISELPVRATVVLTDILPMIDSSFITTSRVTAGQIAALGGGPPGTDMVTTVTIANAAVTAAKVGFTAPQKFLTREAGGAGSASEYPCTTYGRGFLAVANSAEAVQYLGALVTVDSPTFTGTVTINGTLTVSGGINGQLKAADGTAAAPSISFASDLNTGISHLGGADVISVVAGGVEQHRIGVNGAQSAVIYQAVTPSSTLYPVTAHVRSNLFYDTASGIVAGSSGITSVTKITTGQFNVVLATTLPDNAGSLLVSFGGESGTITCRIFGKTANFFQATFNNYTSNALQDPSNFSAVYIH